MGTRFATVVVAFGLLGSLDARVLAHARASVESRPATKEQVRLGAYWRKYQSALVLSAGSDLQGARHALQDVRDDPLFAVLSGADQRTLLSAAAWVELSDDAYAPARVLYARAIQADPSEPDDWHRLSMVESELEDYEAAVATLGQLIHRWPELRDNLSRNHVAGLIYRMDPRSDARIDLLQALFDANWLQDYRVASTVFYRLALARIERGEASQARTVIERIVWPDVLMKIQADKRFDGLLDPDPGFVRQSALELVERLRASAAANPAHLELRNELAYALLNLGLNAAVIDFTTEIQSLITRAPENKAAYLDADELNWTLHYRAIALRRLERLDESLVQITRASALVEHGSENTTQVLSLAEFHCSLGRADEALAAVRGLDQHLSRYGRMDLASVELRAALLMGDDAAVQRALSHLREHRTHYMAVWVDALLRIGRLEEAAQAMAEWLDSAVDRNEVLLWVQDAQRPTPLPGDVKLHANRELLLARKDVQGAVSRVGRIQNYDIHLGY